MNASDWNNSSKDAQNWSMLNLLYTPISDARDERNVIILIVVHISKLLNIWTNTNGKR